MINIIIHIINACRRKPKIQQEIQNLKKHIQKLKEQSISMEQRFDTKYCQWAQIAQSYTIVNFQTQIRELEENQITLFKKYIDNTEKLIASLEQSPVQSKNNIQVFMESVDSMTEEFSKSINESEAILNGLYATLDGLAILIAAREARRDLSQINRKNKEVARLAVARQV